MAKLIILIAIVNCFVNLQVYAQSESYDIYTFTTQPGWQRANYADNIQFTLQKGNAWCVAGLYTSTGTTGTAYSDFQSDWNDLVGKNYMLSSEVSTQQNEVNGWQMTLGTATGTLHGQQLNISLISFSGPTSRGTILMINNDFNNKLESDISAFMGGISVISTTQNMGNNSQYQPPTTDNYQPPTIDNYQPPTMNNYQPPMMGPQMSNVSGNDLPTPNAQMVTRSTTADGWLVEATNDYVQYSNPEIKVIQYFFVAPEDPNSNTDDEDLFWRKYLANYFSANQYNKFPNDPYDLMNRIQSASGYATSLADGRQYFLVWIVSLNMKCSFLAITSDESLYKRYFTHPNDIIAMEKYNYFAVSPQDIQGTWKDTGFEGAQLYSTVTGAYAGMAVASSAVEWNFNGNSTHYHASGATGTVGTLNTYTVDESGSFQLAGFDLVVQVTDPAPGKTHEFWCAYLAGKGGLLLKLQDKKYSAQINFLSRKP